MRHSNQNRKLGRVRKQRKALLNSLARSLVLKEKVRTTEAKAKETRPFVEKLLTAGKKADVAARRNISESIGKEATKKLVDVLAKKYDSRNGGYLRITKMENRNSDGAPMAVIEFI